MTTTYTKIIEEQGAVTLAQFAMRCARGMMPLVSLRDIPIDSALPSKLTPSRGYAEYVAECEAALARVLTITVQEAATMLDARHAKRVATVESFNHRYATMQVNCEQLRAEVEAWVPPTQEHTPLKAFMLGQLDDEIKNAQTMRLDVPVKHSPEQWLAEETADVRDTLDRAKRDLAEELQRTDWNNKWLTDLRENLGITSPYRTAADPATSAE